MRGMAWVGKIFERGCWQCDEGRLMEMEMLDVCAIDNTWVGKGDNNKCGWVTRATQATLAWRRTLWASARIAKLAPRFKF